VNRPISLCVFLAAVLLAAWSVGTLGRGIWTPDEPREADLAWRMSWQQDKAVPLLAGEPFCEKPPLTYWLAAASIGTFGTGAAALRVPNLFYALITALSVGWLARRALGGWFAAVAAAGAISTFLLSYQTAIWLATDAPLVAAVAVALLGEYIGLRATNRRERLAGYLTMHAALAVGFLAKSAAAWMVPVLAFLTIVVWERRWRELLRWELWVGVGLQAAIIVPWVAAVYAGPDGLTNLRVFFWNNLVGRFTNVAAPAELQYATAHRNSPGKYLFELPIYLWPWTLLCIAAAHRALSRWRLMPEPRQPIAVEPRSREVAGSLAADARPGLRFALAVFVPTLAMLSLAATARNIYLAPALPGVALLLAWWAADSATHAGVWDIRALKATAVLLGLAVLVAAALLALVAVVERNGLDAPLAYATVSAAGLLLSAYLTVFAWRALVRGRLVTAQLGLFVAYCSLLVGPASQAYGVVDQWQDLGALGSELSADLGTRGLVLMAPDETTRAWVDMSVRRSVVRIPGPIDATALAGLADALAQAPGAFVLVQLPGRALDPEWRKLAARLGRLPREPEGVDPDWLGSTTLATWKYYALPNGRRYALLRLRR
jgi:4-amino-4-deoxy-L-arabinose transferase-like glycosyltransferase